MRGAACPWWQCICHDKLFAIRRNGRKIDPGSGRGLENDRDLAGRQIKHADIQIGGIAFLVCAGINQPAGQVQVGPGNRDDEGRQRRGCGAIALSPRRQRGSRKTLTISIGRRGNSALAQIDGTCRNKHRTNKQRNKREANFAPDIFYHDNLNLFVNLDLLHSGVFLWNPTYCGKFPSRIIQ